MTSPVPERAGPAPGNPRRQWSRLLIYIIPCLPPYLTSPPTCPLLGARLPPMVPGPLLGGLGPDLPLERRCAGPACGHTRLQ